MCRVKDRYAAGLYVLDAKMRSQGVPPHWLPFINVSNADEIARKASQAGGKVLIAPNDVLDVGRSAALQDPTGANFAIWQARKHKGAAIINEPGAMCWNELMTPDVGLAGRFYRATFGWTADLVDTSADSSYTIFKAGTTQVGGMMARPPRMNDVPPNWLTYFGVTDCDRTATEVGELGGQVLRPPTDIPNIGRFAVCRDAQGAVFAVFTPQDA
jgi:predicted enzyme related to lactoylglutathione lyase